MSIPAGFLYLLACLVGSEIKTWNLNSHNFKITKFVYHPLHFFWILPPPFSCYFLISNIWVLCKMVDVDEKNDGREGGRRENGGRIKGRKVLLFSRASWYKSTKCFLSFGVWVFESPNTWALNSFMSKGSGHHEAPMLWGEWGERDTRVPTWWGSLITCKWTTDLDFIMNIETISYHHGYSKRHQLPERLRLLSQPCP